MSLLICLPQYGGFVTGQNMMSVVGLVRDLAFSGVDFDVVRGSDSAVHRVRYFLTDSFLKTDFERMLFIDSDIEFETGDVMRLLTLDADVAVGAYRMKKEGAKLAAWVGGELLDEFPNDPFEVDYAGTGFMMIKRHVWDRIEHLCENIDTERGVIKKWWGFDVDGGVELPEDYSFCKKVRDCGMKIVCDPDIKLKHYGLHGY